MQIGCETSPLFLLTLCKDCIALTNYDLLEDQFIPFVNPSAISYLMQGNYDIGLHVLH